MPLIQTLVRLTCPVCRFVRYSPRSARTPESAEYPCREHRKPIPTCTPRTRAARPTHSILTCPHCHKQRQVGYHPKYNDPAVAIATCRLCAGKLCAPRIRAANQLKRQNRQPAYRASQPPEPTTAAPGTEQKTAVMLARVEAGHSPFHPADARYEDDPRPHEWLAAHLAMTQPYLAQTAATACSNRATGS